MVVGSPVLRTLEARWHRRTDRVFRNRHHSRLHAALSALSREEALGRGSDGRGCGSGSTFLGCAATDVHLYPRQPSFVAAGTRRGSAPAPVLDTAAVSPMAESACRIRAVPGTLVGVWCGPDYGGCRRQHTLATSAPHH